MNAPGEDIVGGMYDDLDLENNDNLAFVLKFVIENLLESHPLGDVQLTRIRRGKIVAELTSTLKGRMPITPENEAVIRVVILVAIGVSLQEMFGNYGSYETRNLWAETIVKTLKNHPTNQKLIAWAG